MENLLPTYAVPLSERSWIVRKVAKLTGTHPTSWLASEMQAVRMAGGLMRCGSVSDYVIAFISVPRERSEPQQIPNDHRPHCRRN